LYVRDTDPHGFQWLVVDDAEQSVFAFVRFGHTPTDTLVVVANLTPVVRHNHRIGLPDLGLEGTWHEVLNTDSAHYGGGNVGNQGTLQATAEPSHGQAHSALLTLPPLAVLWLSPAA
jgi:1,4-alpha-glucan branching enzyme